MKLRDLLELARVSNLPTVWSNVFLGYFAGVLANSYDTLSDHPDLEPFSASELIQTVWDNPVPVLCFLVVATIPYTLLYSGGMVLNDYLDRSVDAQERPGRPIPSGRVTPNWALVLSIALLSIGFIGIVIYALLMGWHGNSVWASSVFGAGLVGAIVAYNYTHQRDARTVLLMGSCRGLIVLTIASAIQPPVAHWSWWLFVAGPAFTLVIYTVLISIVARREVETKRLAGPKTIMNMIAAMPLFDAVWLLVMGLWPASLFCVACAGLTKLGHKKVAGS